MHRLLYLPLAIAGAGLCAAAAPATQRPLNSLVLILPFSVPAGAEHQWVGKAVQQDLLTDLSQGLKARVVASGAAPAATDAEAARSQAREAGASMVVFGQVQAAGNEMRLTGQIVDVATGQPVGNLKATGPADTLFHLEDALAGQALASVPQGLLTPQALAAEHQNGPAEPTTAQQPQTSYAPSPPTSTYNPPMSEAADIYAPAPTYNYASYTYYEPAPVYSYGYVCPAPAYTYGCPTFDLFPWWTSFVFIGGDFDRHHHHRDFDFESDREGGRFHEGRGAEWRHNSLAARQSAGTSVFARSGDAHVGRGPAFSGARETPVGSPRFRATAASRGSAGFTPSFPSAHFHSMAQAGGGFRLNAFGGRGSGGIGFGGAAHGSADGRR